MARSPTPLVALAAAALCASPACEDLGPVIDPFPITANRDHGPLRVGLIATSDAPVVALVDTNTPLTVLDRETEAPRRLRTDLALMSACPGDSPLSGCPSVERARYDAAAVIETHPCGTDGAACRIGIEPLDGLTCGATAGPDTVGYGAIVGSDLLAQAALRIDLRAPDAPAIGLFPDIAGAAEHHCRTGVAVLAVRLAGGATLEIEGGEVAYPANRVPLNACADYDVIDDEQPSGADLLLLLATGLGPSVISESAYARYYQRLDSFCQRQPDRCGAGPDQLAIPPLYSELPARCLQLPSGPTVARIASLRRLAITGDSARRRGPCEERRGARIMFTDGGCSDTATCPCGADGPRCDTEAAVDLEPDGGIRVAVLPDAHPLLQSLREELRPGLAEADGLLGLDALHGLKLDLDYPGSRMLIECAADGGAGVRPACTAYTEVNNRNGSSFGDRCQ